MTYKGYREIGREFECGSVYKNQVNDMTPNSPILLEFEPCKDEDKTVLFFMCRRCLKRFEIKVDRLIFKLNPSAVASYMKKYCPDCEAYFEMQKEKPEKKDENNLYRRRIEMK